MGLACPPQRARPTKEAVKLIIREVVQQGPETTTPLGGDTVDEPSAGFSEGNANHPPVIRIAMPLNQPAFLHPVDDPGRTGLGHVERFGEPAHRRRTVAVENREYVEVDEAQRAG